MKRWPDTDTSTSLGSCWLTPTMLSGWSPSSCRLCSSWQKNLQTMGSERCLHRGGSRSRSGKLVGSFRSAAARSSVLSVSAGAAYLSSRESLSKTRSSNSLGNMSSPGALEPMPLAAFVREPRWEAREWAL